MTSVVADRPSTSAEAGARARERWLPHLARSKAMLGPQSIPLFCFPHAGGTSRAFDRLLPHLPRQVVALPVALPGRDPCSTDEPFRHVSGLVAALERDLGELLDTGPFAVFGHSMGAKLAFEFTRRALRRGRRAVALVVSACPAPQHDNPRPKWADAPDARLLAHLRSLGGTPEEALDDADYAAWLLRYLRADYSLSETYRTSRDEAISLPLIAMGGRQDPQASSAELEAWRELTTETFELELFSGSHFYFHACPAESARRLARAALDGLARGTAASGASARRA